MSKTALTPRDFKLPKAIGLAVHNARKAINTAKQDSEEKPKGSYAVFPELAAYSLWTVDANCDVRVVGTAPTAAEFAPLVTKANLQALVAKYKPIGFLRVKAPWGKGKEHEIDGIEAPLAKPFAALKEGGRK
jgi:hypothetical protein